VPIHEECLNSIFKALDDVGLTRLTGSQLLEKLDGIADAKWPVAAPSVCGDLFLHPCSAALAFSVALLWTPRKWDAAEAVEMFADLSSDLREIWEGDSHKPEQKLTKTVGHAIIHGIRRKWDPATEVLLYSILGTQAPGEIDYGSPFGKAIYFLRGGAATIGQLSHLDRCWGEDFADAAAWHALTLRSKLLKWFALLKSSDVSGVSFVWNCNDGDDWVEVRPCLGASAPDTPGKRVRAGSKRNFRLAAGAGILYKNKSVEAGVETGQRLILQVHDDRKADIWLPEGEGGDHCWFGPEDNVELVFDDDTDSSLEVWDCTCGSLHCDLLHRSSGWDLLRRPAAATFLSLVHTAVNGPLPNLTVTSFSGGMYYALLCDGDEKNG
jgi:hypothetical protein